MGISTRIDRSNNSLVIKSSSSIDFEQYRSEMELHGLRYEVLSDRIATIDLTYTNKSAVEAHVYEVMG